MEEKNKIAHFSFIFTDKISHLLNKFISSYELPQNSLRYDGKKICIYEPPYPLGSYAEISHSLMTISIPKTKETLTIKIPKRIYDKISLPFPSVPYTVTKPPKNNPLAPVYVNLTFPQNHPRLYDYINDVITYRLEHYSSSQPSFGCCSKFKECSVEKKCLHENKLYSTSCMYRQNLDAGKIFCGKNRNID